MRIKMSIAFFLLLVTGWLAFGYNLMKLVDIVDDYLLFLGNSSFISFIAPYHYVVKICLGVLAMIPLFQTTRLLKTRSATDVSVAYQFFTIIVITCINIDIFRSQFGKADVNYFIILCRYGKLFFYNLNIFLIFYLLGKMNQRSFTSLMLFVGLQMFLVVSMFYTPDAVFAVLNNYIVGFAIAVIFGFGMFKPTLQMVKTLQKRTAKDVSMLYYFAFAVFLFLALLDSLIIYNTKGVPMPVKTILANAVKMVLYLTTFLIIFYIRYIFAFEKKVVYPDDKVGE